MSDLLKRFIDATSGGISNLKLREFFAHLLPDAVFTRETKNPDPCKLFEVYLWGDTVEIRLHTDELTEIPDPLPGRPLSDSERQSLGAQLAAEVEHGKGRR